MVIAILVLIGSIVWLYFAPGFDALISFLLALSSIVSIFIVEKRKKRTPTMNQRISKKSFGIQAKGNVTTGNIEVNKDVK